MIIQSFFKNFTLLQLNKYFKLTSKPANLFLIRHAQSVFNAKCHKYPQDQIYSKQAQQQFHYDTSIIDCPLTERGKNSADVQNIKNSFRDKNPSNTIFFVSPMRRTLQTAQILHSVLQQNYQVKVIPCLTQIISKICDFSSGLKQKKEEFPKFDFHYCDEWIQENGLCHIAQNWQDPFLDDHHASLISNQDKAGKRYLKVLKEVFPKTLESSSNCRKRSLKAFQKIYEISNSLNYRNAVIIAHNRILKYIEQELIKGEPKDYQNLEIRKIKIKQCDYINKREQR